jgi:hypothetical protein
LFWDMTPCTVLGRCQCFRRTFCCHLQDRMLSLVVKKWYICGRDTFALVSLCKLLELGKFPDEVTCLLNLDSVIDRF